MKSLICANCGNTLVRNVTIDSGKDPAITTPTFPDNANAIASGRAYKSYEPFRKSLSEKPDALEYTPQYWMNGEDLADFVVWGGVRNGCCGPDGCDGPNRVCECGTFIGTEMRDCWTSFLFIPDPATTKWETEQ